MAGVVRLWLDLFAPRPFLLPCLSDLVYQRLRIEIVGIYCWRRRKTRWGRIPLDDAEVGSRLADERYSSSRLGAQGHLRTVGLKSPEYWAIFVLPGLSCPGTSWPRSSLPTG